MKARRVKHLDPGGALGDELERIVRVRLDELCGFMPRAADPAEVEHLHDMRIAAKRLRYILEVAEPVLGPYVPTAVKRIKALQDLVGEVHDADVTLPRVLNLAQEARAADVDAVLAAAGDADDVDPASAAGGPNVDAHRGLATLATYYDARRALLFDRFCAMWTALEREGFRARLEFAASERPGPSRDLHGDAGDAALASDAG